MNDLYYNKYLKYKQKYLDLKHGGNKNQKQRKLNKRFENIYEELAKPMEDLYYYINIKYYKDFYFKAPLVKALRANGYDGYSEPEYLAIKNSSGNIDLRPKITEESKETKAAKLKATFVYLHGHDQYSMDDRTKVYDWLTQYPNRKWINLLWGEFKDITTNKAKLYLHFKDKLGYYLTNSYIIREKDKGRNEDIDRIVSNWKDGKPKVLKPSNSYRGKGIVLVNNKEDIYRHIESFDNTTFYNYIYEVHANKWILEDYVEQDKIKGRKFNIRVHILILSKSGEKLKIYISKKQPYFIIKEECKDELLLNDTTDFTIGSHIKIIKKKILTGGGSEEIEDENKDSVIYNFDDNIYWPEDYPDGYNETDKENINTEINKMFNIIFSDESVKCLYPDFNSPNGFQIFACDISFQNIA